MSAKPSDNARWAVDVSDVDASNINIPSSSQKSTGWTLGQKPPSGVMNWWMNRVYRWIKWLDDGDVAFHNLNATGTFAVTGATTASGLITAETGLTASVNQHVTVSGTGQFKHGQQILPLSAASWNGQAAGALTRGDVFLAATGGSVVLFASIPLINGKRIIGIDIRVQDSSTGPTRLQAKFQRVNKATDTVTDVATSSLSSGAGATQTLNFGTLAEDVTSTNAYQIRMATTTGSAPVGIGLIEVFYSAP